MTTLSEQQVVVTKVEQVVVGTVLARFVCSHLFEVPERPVCPGRSERQVTQARLAEMRRLYALAAEQEARESR